MTTEKSSAEFTLNVAVESADTPKAQAELAAMRAELERDLGSLKRMTQAYGNLKKAGLQQAEQTKLLATRIRDKRRAVGDAQTALLKMRGGLAATTVETVKAAKGTKEATSRLGLFVKGMRAAGGDAVVSAGESMLFAKALGIAGIAGAAAGAAVAVVALEVVGVGAMLKLAKTGLLAADAYRMERLAIEASTKTWVGWWGQVRAGNPDDIQKGIDRITGSVTISREAVKAHSEELYKMRLRGAALTKALEAVSLAESAAGPEAANLAKNQILMWGVYGRNVDSVTARIKNKYEPIVKQQMLSFNVQASKARENFAMLFRGLDVGPVQRGLDKVLSLIKRGTVESEAWKAILSSVFNPWFRGAEQAGDLLELFFDRVTLMSLNAAIAWEKTRGAFTLRDSGLKESTDLLLKVSLVATDGAIAFLRLTQGVVIAGQALYNFASIAKGAQEVVFGLAQTFVSHEKGTRTVTEGWDKLAKGAKGIWETFDNAASGKGIINGLIRGIKEAQPLLNKAITDSAAEMDRSFKNAEGIHSPSTKYRKLAGQDAQGLVVGWREAHPKLRRAAEDAAEQSRPEPRRMQGGNLKLGLTANFGDMNFTTQPSANPGAQGGESVPVGQFKAWLESTLEGLAIQMGAKLPV